MVSKRVFAASRDLSAPPSAHTVTLRYFRGPYPPYKADRPRKDRGQNGAGERPLLRPLIQFWSDLGSIAERLEIWQALYSDRSKVAPEIPAWTKPVTLDFAGANFEPHGQIWQNCTKREICLWGVYSCVLTMRIMLESTVPMKAEQLANRNDCTINSVASSHSLSA